MSRNLFGFKPVLLLLFLMALALLPALAGCGSGGDGLPALKVGGIPDQDTARLARRYQVFVDYLSHELGVTVEYVPSVDYAAVVTAFSQDELQMAFFGGLTGVQARLRNPGSPSRSANTTPCSTPSSSCGPTWT